jgi:hypothetical protein
MGRLRFVLLRGTPQARNYPWDADPSLRCQLFCPAVTTTHDRCESPTNGFGGCRVRLSTVPRSPLDAPSQWAALPGGESSQGEPDGATHAWALLAKTVASVASHV